MAVFEITDNTTGFVFEIEGDREPRPDEIRSLIANMEQPGQPIQQQEPSFLESAGGALETGLAVASGIAAEPIAGLAGIATAPFQGSEQATENIQATREALTFQPRTEAGQEGVQQVGEFFEPVAKFLTEAEKSLGDSVFRSTGSPTLAAAATTIPTIATEILGFGLAKGGLRFKKRGVERGITKELKKAAPEPEQLFNVSRGIYNELNNLGVSIKPGAFTGLTTRINSALIKNGIDRDITPKSFKAFNRLKERVGDEITLTELDTLRSVAKGAANDINSPQEALLGNIIIDSIDSFLDASGERIFNKPPDLDVNISKRYKAARNLWGRGRKSELITEALVKAENQATGLENGIRTQFRSILNNKKQRRFFMPSELSDMKRIVQGDRTANFFKLLGKFGFSEGQAKNIIGGSLGLAGGFALGGGTGAAIAATIGSGGRVISRIITEGRANLFNDLIRAGKNARNITQAYLKNTPPKQRSPADLSELLANPDLDLSKLPKSKIVNEAAEIAVENQRAITRGVAASEIARNPRLSLELSLAEEEKPL